MISEARDQLEDPDNDAGERWCAGGSGKCGRDGEKCLESGYILTVELMELLISRI